MPQNKEKKEEEKKMNELPDEYEVIICLKKIYLYSYYRKQR